MLTPYKENLCSKYATKMLSIKINNGCNCNCSFCVDRGGFKPESINVVKIAESAIKQEEYKTVIITGGEPFLVFDKVIELCKILRPHKNRIVLNTNGSLLTTNKVAILNSLIDELQISIHSPNPVEEMEIFKKEITYYSLKQALREHKFLVSINSCFTRAISDKKHFVSDMIDLCNYLNADRLRLTELKKVDEDEFISAAEFFNADHHVLSFSSNELITKGCTSYFESKGIKVSVKRLCEFAKGAHSKNFSCCFIDTMGQKKIDVDTEDTFKVIYSNGMTTNDWIFKD